MAHWTYASPKEVKGDLQQGDILGLNEDLCRIFGEIHKHFCDPKYCAFLVLTQTCDLVRHDGNPCKSRYVTLAAVRPLLHVLQTYFDRLCRPVGEGVYTQERRIVARQFLRRVFNQNEKADGLFYLHPDTEVGIDQRSVAILQVSVAFRASTHYETLVSARTGRLSPEFQSRLGWLVGNLFSRVATRDWLEKNLQNMVIETMDEAERGSYALWVPAEAKKEAKKVKGDLSGFSGKDLVNEINRYAPPPAIDQIAARVAEIAREALKGLTGDQVDTLRGAISRDTKVNRIIKTQSQIPAELDE